MPAWPAHDAQLAELHARGLSAADIARKLHTTPNAVRGRAWRLHLSWKNRPPPGLTTGKITCCWPLGEPGSPNFRFCDKPAIIGRPYCPDHAVRAYVAIRVPAAQAKPPP